MENDLKKWIEILKGKVATIEHKISDSGSYSSRDAEDRLERYYIELAKLESLDRIEEMLAELLGGGKQGRGF